MGDYRLHVCHLGVWCVCVGKKETLLFVLMAARVIFVRAVEGVVLIIK